MKVGSKDARECLASFALLFVNNYAILDLSDKISAPGWWIPKCCFFTALKLDNALLYIHVPGYLERDVQTYSTYSIFSLNFPPTVGSRENTLIKTRSYEICEINVYMYYMYNSTYM